MQLQLVSENDTVHQEAVIPWSMLACWVRAREQAGAPQLLPLHSTGKYLARASQSTNQPAGDGLATGKFHLQEDEQLQRWLLTYEANNSSTAGSWDVVSCNKQPNMRGLCLSLTLEIQVLNDSGSLSSRTYPSRMHAVQPVRRRSVVAVF